MRPLASAAALILALILADGDPIDDLLRGQPVSPSAAPAAVPDPASTTCEAPSLAYLVGRPKTDIPVPVDPSRRRVSCATCPVTQDYRPDRTNIIFDQTTGLVTAVKCG